MANINERLQSAARAGAEHELKALLRDPGCDALGMAKGEMTALMVAVYHGHEGCVRFLLPSSDALSMDKDGWTALMYAALLGHEGCIRILLPVSDACALAQSERAFIESAASPGAPRSRAALRV